MEQEKIFSLKNILTVAFVATIVTVLTLGLSLWQTPKYKASAKLMVIINQDNVDSYTASRSADYIANILTEVLYSNSFMNQVLTSGFNVQDNFGFSTDERLNNWEKEVKTQVKQNEGIILLDVMGDDQSQAQKIAQSTSYLLMTRNSDYHGLGNKISVKILDNASISYTWSQNKIATNTGLGFLAGLVLGFFFIIIFPQQQLLAVFFGYGKKRKDETIELTQPEDYWSQNYETPTFPTEIINETESEQEQTEENKTDKNGNQYYGW
ncbi:MAG: hypothetical protein WCP18_00480 [bacterium]